MEQKSSGKLIQTNRKNTHGAVIAGKDDKCCLIQYRRVVWFYTIIDTNIQQV